MGKKSSQKSNQGVPQGKKDPVRAKYDAEFDAICRNLEISLSVQDKKKKSKGAKDSPDKESPKSAPIEVKHSFYLFKPEYLL